MSWNIRSPFGYRLNPDVEHARRHVVDWVQQVGLVRGDLALRRFARTDFGAFAASVYPAADRETLALCADWLVWMYMVDDHLDEGGFGKKPGNVAPLVRAMTDLPGHAEMDAAVQGRADVPTSVSSLADLWRRTTCLASQHWRSRIAQNVEACLTGAVWEAGNRERGRVPDEEAYFARRLDCSGCYIAFDLIEIVQQIDVTPAIYDDPGFRATRDAAANIIIWMNDVYSLEKERSVGEMHNFVYIVEHHRGLGTEEAVQHVCAAIEAETARYLDLELELLRAHRDHLQLIAAYVQGLRSWMRGHLQWTEATTRFRSLEEPGMLRPEQYLEPGLMTVDG